MDVSVMSKWKFRPPPRGVSRDQLILCPVTGAGNTCSLGMCTCTNTMNKEFFELDISIWMLQSMFPGSHAKNQPSKPFAMG